MSILQLCCRNLHCRTEGMEQLSPCNVHFYLVDKWLLHCLILLGEWTYPTVWQQQNLFVFRGTRGEISSHSYILEWNFVTAMINVNIISALNSPFFQDKNTLLDFLILFNKNHKGTEGKERSRERSFVSCSQTFFEQSSCQELKSCSFLKSERLYLPIFLSKWQEKVCLSASQRVA